MSVQKQLLKLTTNMCNAELDWFLFQRISWEHRHRMVFASFANLAFPFHLVSKDWNCLLTSAFMTPSMIQVPPSQNDVTE